MKRIVYLHGFRSSAQSFKAQLFAKKLAELGQVKRWHCPQLAASPRLAIEQVESLALQPGDTLIGSSLGGYYATYLAEKYGCRAVLLNPAIYPARDLAAFVGEHKAFPSETPFLFEQAYLQELAELFVCKLTLPERYYLIAAKGDELLDWRDMVARYPKVKTKLLEGSDHGLSDFVEHMDEVLGFCGAK